MAENVVWRVNIDVSDDEKCQKRRLSRMGKNGE